MKTFVKITFCGLLIFSMACKKKAKWAESEDSAVVEIKTETKSEVNISEFKEADSCDEFIDRYEVWMEKYMGLLEKHKDNPIDLVSAPEFTEMTVQAADWASNWSTKLATSCATDPNYEKRIREIQERMERKMKEIGLK